ncbi:hypothetical protein PV325_010272 [Microctonus aethiopoides]|nr:hypothetical protein PV325_010272 [Microctonus aethiopoides]
MNVIYVDMVVLGCLIQIFIGSSYELPNDSCSPFTCDENERCEIVNEHVSSCVCLSKAFFNGTTRKCELNSEIRDIEKPGFLSSYFIINVEEKRTSRFEICKRTVFQLHSQYDSALDLNKRSFLESLCKVKDSIEYRLRIVKEYQWVKYTPEMWNDTRLVRFDSSNPLKVVGRRKFDNDIISVSSYIKKENKELPDGTEVLLIEPGHGKWIRSSNGVVKNNAIEGGIKDDTVVYVCRANIGIYDYLIGWSVSAVSQ